MSPLAVENRLLVEALLSIIRSCGGHIEHRFSYFWKAGLARTLFIPGICLKDFAAIPAIWDHTMLPATRHK